LETFSKFYPFADELTDELVSWQDKYVTVKRFYINCFNVDHDFAENFKFPKSRVDGFFEIDYMECAFNREFEWGEILIEFKDQIKEDRLIKFLESQGACQVVTQTFPRNDGHLAAANAVLRIKSQVEKGWASYSRGTCPPNLLAKIQERQQQEAANKETDEKTREAQRQSLLLQQDTNEKVTTVGSSVEQIKDGVCVVIPDYQKKIEGLERALAHKTKECDRIERLKGADTHTINVLEFKVEEIQGELTKTKAENLRLKETIISLNEQFNLCASVNKMERMMETFSANMEERAAKRPRDD
jgi:hypothetical protein